MSDSSEWRAKLEQYVMARREPILLPDGHMLDHLSDWQRRITGGSMREFFEYIVSDDARARYPALHSRPVEQRTFVCVTDVSGAVAYRELVDKKSDKAICLFKEEWRAFLDDRENDHDDAFEHHYEFWSVWHQQLDPAWDIPEVKAGQLWVHEEGFALADGAGRGSQNLWGWDGVDMYLVRQDMTKWVD